MILLLAGTQEARQLAECLLIEGVRAIASLAGATRNANALALKTRVGGFGGDAGFEQFLSDHNIKAVIDATHPFAMQVTVRTARICAEKGVPYLRVERPGWTAGPLDRWTWIDREEEAAAYIGADDCVFLATGRQTLDRFANLEGRRVICRQIDPPTAPFPFSGGEFVIGRPPFSQEAEESLFEALGVDWLVVKDAGGTASRSKLDAARALKIPVLILRRQAPPPGDFVTTVADAMTWARRI